MIFWKDFILDDFCGPVLSFREGDVGSDIMEDGSASSSYQETRREKEPARMVGQSVLDSKNSLCMEADEPLSLISRIEGAT